MATRALKFKFTPNDALKKQIVLMSWAARELTRDLVRYARYLNKYKGRACEVISAQGKSCPIQKWNSEQKKWVDIEWDKNKIHPGVEQAIVPVMKPGTVQGKGKKQKITPARLVIEQYGETKKLYWDNGTAWEVLQTLYSGKSSVYPQKEIEFKQTKGKSKGEIKLINETKQRDEKADYSFVFPYDGQPCRVSLSGKTVGVIAKVFDGNFESFKTHIKKGNTKAKPPYKDPLSVPIPFNKEEIRWEGNALRLGCSSKKERHKGVTLTISGLRELKGQSFQDAKIIRSINGEYWLHLTREKEIKEAELPGRGAIDFGQKRAIVIANEKGETATIPGNNICAIKRVQDRRRREIGRLRSRTFRGQVRQYLSKEEQATMLKMDREKPGSGQKYAWRLIAERRRKGIDGKGRSLVELGQQPVFKNGKSVNLTELIKRDEQPDTDSNGQVLIKSLHKRSQRQFKLLKANRKISARSRQALDYANHCVTRAAVDWAVKHGIGTIYVGELDNLPKGRKKGNRRIKQVKRNNLWEWPTQIKYLVDKLAEAGGIDEKGNARVIKESERNTSRKCPRCGQLNKPRDRRYYCNPKKGGCGYKGDRDQVGAINFLSQCLGLETGQLMPTTNEVLHISPAARGSKRLKPKNPKNKFIYLRSTKKHRAQENSRSAPAERKISSDEEGVSKPIGRLLGSAEQSVKGHTKASADVKNHLLNASDSAVPKAERKPRQGRMQASAGSEKNTSRVGDASSQTSTLKETGAIETDSEILECANGEVFSKGNPKKRSQKQSQKGFEANQRSEEIRANAESLNQSKIQAKQRSSKKKKTTISTSHSAESAQSNYPIQLEFDLWGTADETSF